MATLLHRLRARLTVLIFLASFRLRTVRWALTARPMAGADGADDAGGDDDGDDDSGDDKDDADKDDDAAGDKDDADDKPTGPADKIDWKREARRREREAKKARKERDEINQRLQAREQQDMSEQEKAVEEAEQKGRTEASAAHEKERRADRLENATLKIAAKGLKVGDGDDEKTVRFADPDDALLHLEREIRNGDLDEDDIFDANGRVKTDQLQDALTDLLSRKPHLAAGDKPTTKVQGSADGGKGTPAKTDESVEDHLKKVRRNTGTQAQQFAIGRRAG